MGVIVAIILMGLFSIAAGDPSPGQDDGLCSQFYFMNQYCTSQPRQSSTAVSHRHVRPPMRVKAGPRGPPGIVNKTEINEIITGRFSELTTLKDRIKRKFSRWRREADSEMKRMKAEIASQKNDLEEKIEWKFTSWRMEAECNMRRVKAWIEKGKCSCAITFNGTCYWTHVENDWNVNFTQAEEICSDKASTPAQFPNDEVYNGVVENIRSNLPSGLTHVRIWTGVTFDATTGNVIHPSGDTYVKWFPGHPLTGSTYKTYTNVILGVNSDPGYPYQEMHNYLPQERLHGVVCQSVE